MLSPEQRNAPRDDELSFRHMVGRGARSDYTDAMNWLDRSREIGGLLPVESAVLVHRLEREDFSAIGFIADVSLDAYDRGGIKKHEATIAKTQDKMVDYMQSTRLFGNPVALAYRDRPELAQLLDHYSQGAPDLAFESIDRTRHAVWVVGGEDARTVCDGFADMIYITDGHHRLAAAAALAAEEGRSNAYLPAALFAESELTLGAFARAIDDESVVAEDVLDSLRQRFELRQVDQAIPRPAVPHEIGVRIDDRSFLLTIPEDSVPGDTYESLDVNLLQDLVLEPLFGVTDPRADHRVRFVADTADSDHDVGPDAVWFLPYPAPVSDVMIVADSGRAMPPKSTYFMPKVPSGLVIRRVDVA